MRIYIDTNTFPASPALYADAEKTKPLPRILPAVELQRGGFEVAFIGSNQPQDIATVALAASVEGAQTQVVAELGKETDNGEAWRFDFALNSESLVAEVANRGSARLRVGVIVEDDTERREWQFTTVVYPTASSGETDVEAVESAKDWAELAEQSAKDAQAAQVKVSADAQAAQESKQTATQAANAAIEAADNAEVAEQNAAESKGAAEKAKTDAESAKTAAEKAASDAQATLANVYTKPEIDGVSTGAEVTLKMNEIAGYLKRYEDLFGEPFPLDEELINAIKRWQENPNNVVNWDGANCPYLERVATASIVDFQVSSMNVLNGNHGALNKNTNVPVFLTKCVRNPQAFYGNKVFNSPCIFIRTTSSYGTFLNATAFNNFALIDDVITGTRLFEGASSYDKKTRLPKLSDGASAFKNTAMSAENISATLDSLPAWADGASHVITFTGSPGASELTQESPSVAAAIAKGWTVEL